MRTCKKGFSGDSGPTVSPMIKLAKNMEGEKSSGRVGSAYLP